MYSSFVSSLPLKIDSEEVVYGQNRNQDLVKHPTEEWVCGHEVLDEDERQGGKGMNGEPEL